MAVNKNKKWHFDLNILFENSSFPMNIALFTLGITVLNLVGDLNFNVECQVF